MHALPQPSGISRCRHWPHWLATCTARRLGSSCNRWAPRWATLSACCRHGVGVLAPGPRLVACGMLCRGVVGAGLVCHTSLTFICPLAHSFAPLAHPISSQVGAFTDFEEMLNDVREECHAAVEAYLTMQASSCWLPGVVSDKDRKCLANAHGVCFTGFQKSEFLDLWTQPYKMVDYATALQHGGREISLLPLLSTLPRCETACWAPACLQNVEVRRGRLIAQTESFVNMLGTAIETLLNQVGGSVELAVPAAHGSFDVHPLLPCCAGCAGLLRVAACIGTRGSRKVGVYPPADAGRPPSGGGGGWRCGGGQR